MLKINEIYLDDCIEMHSKIDDESVDLICIDPPYEIYYDNNDWDKKGKLNWEKIK